MKSNQPHNPSTNKQLTQWFILGLLCIVLIAAESFAIYTVFTSRFPSGNDFFVRWLGGREYLRHGTNPFDRTVAEDAQKAMFGRLTRPEDRDQAYFAYPLYTFYFFLPLSLLPYAWAQAIWMTLLQFMLLGCTLLAIRLINWQPPPWLFWLTVFWGIFFYNGARSILLGQFSVLVTLALFLALWAIQNQRDGWAGIFLAVTTIKPQVVFLILLFLMLWALIHHRWWIIGSFISAMLFLVLTSIAMVPTWPFDFVRNVIAYSDYVAIGTPLENLLHYFLPSQLATFLTVLLSWLLFLALLPGWWLALRHRPGGYTWAVMSTLIVSSLLVYRSATTNQLILYLPLFFFFKRLFLQKKNMAGPVALIEIGLLLFMWIAFALTLEGNWEHSMMHGLFPALMLLLYAFDWQALWRTAVAEEVPQ